MGITIISSKKKLLNFNLTELWEYRDLILILVKRDFTSFYKQTILGPLWFFIQPLISSLTYFFIFNKVAGISTNNVNPILFYMSGIIAWEYFSNCLIMTSNTFLSNANLFGKVYFPRFIVPLSIVISNLARFFIQLIMFFVIFLYVSTIGEISYSINIYSLIGIPLLILQMAIFSIGIGMIISSLTIKYRDLKFLINFGTQLLMYGSAIVYPLSIVPDKYKIYILINPMTGIIACFRQFTIGGDFIGFEMIIQSIVITIITFALGLFIFSIVEQNFIDSI